VYVVDIRNPRRPTEVDFIPAVQGNFHGEGAHVISVDTKTFTGDLLAVNNEKCIDTDAGGGFDLYDVTAPRNPNTLVQGAGDHGGEGRMNGTQPSNTFHSMFMWKDDGKVYLVGTDNEELHDVDIFDITNPRAPKPVAEYDLLESFPQISQTAEHPRLSEIFQHDMVTKVIEGRDVLLNSYWDGGHVMLDVENPAKARYIGDSDFADEDPLVPRSRRRSTRRSRSASATSRSTRSPPTQARTSHTARTTRAACGCSASVRPESRSSVTT
jgi:hypothetical protein